MNADHFDIEKLKTELKNLKRLLIFHTIIYVSLIFYVVAKNYPEVQLDNNLYQSLVWLNLIVIFYFIWFLWTKMPTSQIDKIRGTLLIFFLGILGMWIWFPSKRKIEELNKQ
ncbi:hypothetical protein [Namhaeicola litoreus]|uniref:Uncharacterized protein n=1 Tax=Namhaeicola litoreus TaxID=1052145 RepID=A0ABW3Y133_9FLAO